MKKRLRKKAWLDFLRGRKTPLTRKLGLNRITPYAFRCSYDLESGSIESKWDIGILGHDRYETHEGTPRLDGLEDEIDRVIADYSFTKTIDSGGFKTTVLDYEKIARHFAEWMRRKMMKEGLDAVKSCQFDKIDKTIAGVFVKYGMDMQKKDMMKEAVEGEVVQDAYSRELRAKTKDLRKYNLKFGDKIKLIIIKD